jgi:phage regulator Rha-like protein
LEKLEQTISSVEVAEMIGKDHNKLLRDIRSYIDQFSLSKIGQSDFLLILHIKMEEVKNIHVTK